ncbi:MAG: hypothetical protein M5U13_05975 [Thermoanaerobaculia bacterium]|nr:hypothetical protein [Thermoanaerobaculia bacterium]
MSSKHHTVIFVPHERAQFRKWRVSNRQLGVVIGSVALALLGGLVSLALFLSSTTDRGELSRLAAENEQLRGLNQEFETRLTEFRERLAESEDRTRKLAIVAGLQSLGASAEGASAGPSARRRSRSRRPPSRRPRHGSTSSPAASRRSRRSWSAIWGWFRRPRRSGPSRV